MLNGLIEKVRQCWHELKEELLNPLQLVDGTRCEWDGVEYGLVEKKHPETGEIKFEACVYGIKFEYPGSQDSNSLLDKYINNLVFQEALAEEPVFRRCNSGDLPYLDKWIPLNIFLLMVDNPEGLMYQDYGGGHDSYLMDTGGCGGMERHPHSSPEDMTTRVPMIRAGARHEANLNARRVIDVYNKYKNQMEGAISAAAKLTYIPADICEARKMFRSFGLTYLKEKG